MSLVKTLEQTNGAIEKKIAATENSIIQYLEDEFQQEINDFFAELDDYLLNYQDSLKQALQDQKNSLIDRGELNKLLDSFVNDCEQFKEAIEENIKFTRQLM